MRTFPLLFALLGSQAALAIDWAEIPYRYSALTEAQLGKVFPLRVLPALDPQKPVPGALTVGPSGAHWSWLLREDDRPGQPVTLSGKDKAGQPWQVILGELGGCAPWRVFSGDVDGDGVQDALVAQQTCGNGLAAPLAVSVITFDAQGRPLLFNKSSYFDLGEQPGVGALRDLDGDGKAEWLDMRFGNGYWATRVYQARQGQWQTVGKLAGQSYPQFVRFTDAPNHQLAQPKGKAAWLSEQAQPMWQGKLQRITVQDDGDQAWRVRLQVRLDSGKSVSCDLAEEAVWLDERSAGRKVYGDLTAAGAALRTLRAGTVVQGQGQLAAGGCQPAQIRTGR